MICSGFAILTVCRVWKSFNMIYKNPFAYFTQCIHNAYFQYTNAERKQRDIKDEIRVNSGLNSSFNYGDRYAEMHGLDSGSDSYGDNDYMDLHDRIDPYADDVENEEKDFANLDPTAPGEVITLSEEEIRILQLGID